MRARWTLVIGLALLTGGCDEEPPPPPAPPAGLTNCLAGFSSYPCIAGKAFTDNPSVGQPTGQTQWLVIQTAADQWCNRVVDAGTWRETITTLLDPATTNYPNC